MFYRRKFIVFDCRKNLFLELCLQILHYNACHWPFIVVPVTLVEFEGYNSRWLKRIISFCPVKTLNDWYICKRNCKQSASKHMLHLLEQ